MILSDNDIIKLRKEIVLDSIYYADYENSYNIDPHLVCDFFDGFISYIDEIITESKAGKKYDKHIKKSKKFQDKHSRKAQKIYNKAFSKNDNAENLIEWYNIFEIDPFDE